MIKLTSATSWVKNTGWMCFQTWRGRHVARMARAVAPFFTIVLVGVFFFHKTMFESVRSSPHPELVYIMVGVFFVAVCANLWTLQRNVHDGLLTERWRGIDASSRSSWVAKLPGASAVTPVFKLLLESSASGRGRIEAEMLAVRQRMSERTSLSDFLGNAMIGLGLVGTFIGLLSVLQDLAGLFSLMSGPQAATEDSAKVFGQLVNKLQEPMRGMGTAFLASLYGLAGSLLLGLLTQSVKHAGHQTMVTLRETVQTEGFEVMSAVTPDAQRWQALLKAQREEHQAFLANVGLAMDELSRSLGHMPQLVQALQQRTAIDAQVQQLLGQGVHWHDAWEQIADQLQLLRRQDADQAQQLLNALRQHSQEHSQALQCQAQQAAQLSTQEAAKRDLQWQSVLSLQKEAFEQTSLRLRSLTAALVDQAARNS